MRNALNLEIAISKDENGEQIQKYRTRDYDPRKRARCEERKAEEYNAIAKALDYPTNPEEQELLRHVNRRAQGTQNPD